MGTNRAEKCLKCVKETGQRNDLKLYGLSFTAYIIVSSEFKTENLVKGFAFGSYDNKRDI